DSSVSARQMRIDPVRELMRGSLPLSAGASMRNMTDGERREGARRESERRDGVRVAAIGDIHFSKSLPGPGAQVFNQISHVADVLAIVGDLTDTGLPEEAQALARALTQSVAIPVVAVLGNHD